VKKLWAPWRLEGILESMGKECIFCGLPRQNNDEENFIIWRGELTFVMLNRFPYNNGHLMVAPFRHEPDIEGLTDEEWLEMFRATTTSLGALKEALGPDGFNVGINVGSSAGAGFPGHVHVHIVPRWTGDTSFMPILADTKVLSESLADNYRRLRPFFSPPARSSES